MTVRRSRLALLLVPVALAAACTGGGGDQPAAASGQELKIGLIAPLTGPDATAGKEARQGALLAQDIINGLNPSVPLPLAADAGLPNLGGAKIKVLVQSAVPDNSANDQNSSQQVAGDAVTKLVSDQGVNALIGAYDPQITEFASQRSERYEVPFVNADSPATFLTDAGRDWFFRIGPSWRTSGEAFYSLLQEKQNAAVGKTVVLFADDPAGQDVLTTVSELAQESGRGKPIAVPFSPDGSNVAGAVAQAQAQNPDSIFLYVTPSTVQPMLAAFAARQYKPKAAMAFSLGYLSASAFAPAGPTADGLLRSVSWSIEAAERNPAAQVVTQMYLRRYNTQMTEEAASAFTAVMTLAQAANNAGTLDSQRLRTSLLSLNIPGEQTIMPWSGIQFDETHQNVLAQSLIEQYGSSAFHIVYPSDAAAANSTFVWPAPNSATG